MIITGLFKRNGAKGTKATHNTTQSSPETPPKKEGQVRPRASASTILSPSPLVQVDPYVRLQNMSPQQLACALEGMSEVELGRTVARIDKQKLFEACRWLTAEVQDVVMKFREKRAQFVRCPVDAFSGEVDYAQMRQLDRERVGAYST